MNLITEMTWYWFFTGIIMIIPHLVCCFVLPKRSHFAVRFIIGTILSIVWCFFDPMLPMSIISIWSIHATGILMTVLCNKLTFGQYVYFNVWSIVLYFTAEQAGAIIAAVLDSYNELTVMYITKTITTILIVLTEILILRQILKKGIYLLHTKQIVLTFLISVLIIGMNVFGFTGTNNRHLIEFLFQFVSFLVAILALYMQVVIAHGNEQKNEADIMKYLMKENKKNYEMKKAYVDLVDRKYHDMKYEIKALRQLAGNLPQERINELDSIAEGYRNLFHTGNEVLDTIINDKKRECDGRNIIFTCASHINNLDFIDLVDLNILLGNMIDNAVEAVMPLPEEKRVIDIKIYNDKQYVRIRQSNYFSGDLKYSGDNLVTSKNPDGYHGFGTRSMKYVVNKYGGEMVINTDNQLFQLHIMIPIEQ